VFGNENLVVLAEGVFTAEKVLVESEANLDDLEHQLVLHVRHQ